jgi:osmotically-inducible protein OsmY
MSEDLPRTYAGRGPKNYRRSDERLRDELCERLTRDPYVDASDIEVQVRDGEVIFTGTVSDRDQKYRAEDIAESVTGVNDVTNHIRIRRDAPATGFAAGDPAERGESALPPGSRARVKI